MNFQPEPHEVFIQVVHARDHVVVRLEEDSAVVSKKRCEELERGRPSFAVRSLAMQVVVVTGRAESRLGHWPVHGFHRR